MAVAPEYAQLSTKYPDVVFLKLNVDVCRVSADRDYIYIAIYIAHVASWLVTVVVMDDIA